MTVTVAIRVRNPDGGVVASRNLVINRQRGSNGTDLAKMYPYEVHESLGAKTRTATFRHRYGDAEHVLVQRALAALDRLPRQHGRATERLIEQAIGYDPITASWSDEKGAHSVVTHMAVQDRDRIVKAIVEALNA